MRHYQHHVYSLQLNLHAADRLQKEPDELKQQYLS
jgi:hypothetical protein